MFMYLCISVSDVAGRPPQHQVIRRQPSGGGSSVAKPNPSCQARAPSAVRLMNVKLPSPQICFPHTAEILAAETGGGWATSGGNRPIFLLLVFLIFIYKVEFEKSGENEGGRWKGELLQIAWTEKQSRQVAEC